MDVQSLSRHCSLCKYHQSYSFTSSFKQLQSTTLGNLLAKAAEEAGETLAIVVKHENIRKTFNQFNQEVNKLAAGLISLGLKKGDRVGMWGPNCYEWLLVQYATAKAGNILVTINPAYRAKELEYALNKVGCHTLISSSNFKTQDYYQLLCEVSPDLRNARTTDIALSKLPHLKRIITINGKPKPGTITFRSVMNVCDAGHFQRLEEVSKQIQFDDPVIIQFTSGTTGAPKGATLSHFNIINNVLFFGNRLGFHEEKPVICLQVPLYHCFGCILGSTCSVLFKGTLILPSPSFEVTPSLRIIHSERCTVIYGTPTMYIDILNDKDLKQYDLSSLKLAVMSGAPCPVQLVESVKDKFGVQDIRIPYGCTEASPVITLTAAIDPEEKKIGTVGRPLDFLEVKLVDDEDQLVKTKAKGEVCIRGHATFLGYWGDPDKTNQVMKRDKWYHTGDIGVMDERGCLSIVGRKIDIIIRGGENIYPKEIEDFLVTHPLIADAQVVGVPDKRMGEEICAWVRLTAGQNMTEKELKEFCKLKISHFKIPHYILFVEDFPKTVTGKVQKFLIKEESIKRLNLSNA